MKDNWIAVKLIQVLAKAGWRLIYKVSGLKPACIDITSWLTTRQIRDLTPSGGGNDRSIICHLYLLAASSHNP
ncbi:hypothetical protein [Chryseobacterium arthrosphaerae]|uniref:hypothetical protein n=1 Tax=Chryseobacterium arthrosphaerae TaxID=651561 RepID=UPI000F509256|nr:hypothetical protein [Chryseobacterium arthrosphaerae]